MFERENLITTLKDRQKNHKCLICGREIDKNCVEEYVSLYHFGLGDVLIHTGHIKYGFENEVQI